ncbi:hypothetical protein BV25DRAFT_1995787 [Artomyces pyxidatus]|uniref:Uncharacterized protein n=1 Tax=Artomyces pyxidatus TaxID=48021 RepID=A0ACB8SJ85_9AGAM|nr:hypothetical protein BV25DRAFT_1995787 [Artomyces pyxidatus]
MHFAKTYADLLLTLPPELRDNAIEYRKVSLPAALSLATPVTAAQLKKLIRDIVHELETIGLSPEVLQRLLSRASPQEGKGKEGVIVDERDVDGPPYPKIAYEVAQADSQTIEPRLHFWIPSPIVPEASLPASLASSASPEQSPDLGHEALAALHNRDSLLCDEQSASAGESQLKDERATSADVARLEFTGSELLISRLGAHDKIIDGAQQVIIPLVHEAAFYTLLSSTLSSMATHMQSVRVDFLATLETLGDVISHASRPMSATPAFIPRSPETDPAELRSPTFDLMPRRPKSDLYAWRAIFALYAETEVFESMREQERGERTVKDAESRLKTFTDGVKSRLRRRLRQKESREALDTFLRLNILLLDLKKFEYANAEAMRKILKKHAKRTALPPPLLDVAASPQIPATLPAPLVIPGAIAALQHTLVQAVNETLLPIIPQVDDYACLICTSIAFMPIRLVCGHLFCVRCLVKMQKRGKGNCPMCRAQTVLQADRTNVDWALLNFLLDWFPEETREKTQSNEREAARERLTEMGFNPSRNDGPGCIIC